MSKNHLYKRTSKAYFLHENLFRESFLTILGGSMDQSSQVSYPKELKIFSDPLKFVSHATGLSSMNYPQVSCNLPGFGAGWGVYSGSKGSEWRLEGGLGSFGHNDGLGNSLPLIWCWCVCLFVCLFVSFNVCSPESDIRHECNSGLWYVMSVCG